MSEPTTGGEVVDLAVEQAALASRLGGGPAQAATPGRHLGRGRRRAGRRVHRRRRPRHDREAPARAGGVRPHRRRPALAGRALRHRPQRRAARHRLAGAVRRRSSTRPGFDEPLEPRAPGHLRRLHRRPVRRGLRVRRGVRHLAAARRALPQPRQRDAHRGRDPAVRAGRAGAARPHRQARAARRPGHRQDGRGAAPRRVARLQRHPPHRRAHPGDRPERQVPPVRGRGAAHARRGPDHPDHLRPAARTVVRRGQRRAVARRPRPLRGRDRPARTAQGRAARGSASSEVAELVERVGQRTAALARQAPRSSSSCSRRATGCRPPTVGKEARAVWPAWTTAQVLKRLRSRAVPRRARRSTPTSSRPGWPRTATARSPTRSAPASRACPPPTAT